MHDIIFIKMDDVSSSTTQRNVDQTQIEMGSPDYDRDDETEDQILISPSDTDRKDRGYHQPNAVHHDIMTVSRYSNSTKSCLK